MALINECIPCPLCHKDIDLDRDLFSTWGVFFPQDHRLFAFCDMAIHWDCYERWPDRAEFAKGYFQMWVEAEQSNPYWGKALLSDEVFVTVNPSPDVSKVSVLLSETGSDIRIPLQQWNSWISNNHAPLLDLHTIEREALNKVMPLLRVTLPNAETLVNLVNWAAKQEILDLHRERTRQLEEERLRKPKAHNKACRSLLREGTCCPYCNSDDIQLMTKRPEDKSSFLCKKCELSFGPVEVILKHLYG